MDDGAPTLEVGFAIDTGGSFESLIQLANVMNSTEAKIVADAANIERATGGMVNLSGAIASISTYGNAATRELQNISREKAKTEKSGEALIRQLDREALALGKTRDEMRDAKVEAVALAAAQQGNADLADRLLGAARQRQFAANSVSEVQAEAAARAAALRIEEAAAAAAAREIEIARERAAAEALVNAQLLERSRLEAAIERNTGVGRIRATDNGATFSALAARAADDEARATTLAAASAKRLSDEHERLAAAVRGSQAAQEADAAAAERLRAATDPLYAATQRLNAEIAESTRLYHSGATAPAEYARQQQVLTERLSEVERAHIGATSATGKLGGASRLARGDMLNLGYQLNDVFVSLASGQKPMTVFVQQGAQIGQIAASSGVGLRGMAASVGALLVPLAPLIAVMAVAAGGFALFSRSVSEGVDTNAIVNSLGLTRDEIKRLKDTSVTTGDVVKATFQVMAERVGVDLSRMKGWFGSAMDYMTKVGADALAGLYAGFTGTFAAIGIVIRDLKAGNATAILGDIDKDMTARFDKARAALGRFGADVKKQIATDKRAQLEKQAAEIKADRTPKTDGHAAQIARDAEAVEAQIRNLYNLADAYGVSGAAALIAEARVKAESQAIKQRGDIEAAIDRQIRLSIAQRVSDAAKAAAAMREQARVQTEVNGMVAAGTIPAERAADLLRDRIAELPLLAAIEAAQQRGLKTEVDKATAALEAQRSAQEDARAAAMGAQFVADDAAADRRLAVLAEELRLVDATDAARVHALATITATQEAEAKYGAGSQFATDYIAKQVEIADRQQALTEAQNNYNASLSFTADLYDAIDESAQKAASGMASAFGKVGSALGDALTAITGYYSTQAKLQQQHDAAIKSAGKDQAAIDNENRLFAIRSSSAQIGAFGDMAAAAKGFFKEGSSGYQALQKAEQAFRAIQFVLSVRAIAQDAIETGTKIANTVARTAVSATEAVVNAIKSLPFPLNLVAGAATIAAIASLGVSIAGAFGGGGNRPAPSNTGTGTVLGDSDAKSDSIKRAIDLLKEVDTVTSVYARQMATSLRSIDSQIGGLASLVVRNGDINASAGVTEGFKPNLLGSVLGAIPLIGGLLGSLFGSKTSVTASGLYGLPQSVGSILGGGFNAQAYSDVDKTHKFFGITTGHSYSTEYGSADPALSTQFTLILRQFNDAIAAAAGPLGESTDAIQQRLNGFVVDIGKIDLKGLTGEEIQEKLSAIFGAAADNMANAAFPGIERFQKVGEGAFETLVRVASSVEAVTSSLNLLGDAAYGMSIDAKVGLADQFDSVSDLTGAAQAYFETFYSSTEQVAARVRQFTGIFQGLGFELPRTMEAFRQLVEAQDLTTAAGQATYATLLQLAPAFADLKTAMQGSQSAADIASERQGLQTKIWELEGNTYELQKQELDKLDFSNRELQFQIYALQDAQAAAQAAANVLTEREGLQRRLLELAGDTAALRALDLAKLDATNRALQESVWAIEDAQAAAKTAAAAADQLRQAWTSVGDSIQDEIERIRGLAGTDGQAGFATLMGQFNAANAAARGGDQDAAKSLPGLSQALLSAAADAATSRQELDRVQAQTAASLEATYAAIEAFSASAIATPTSLEAMTAAVGASQAASSPPAANDDLATEVRALREEVAQLRSDNNAGHAATAGNTGAIRRTLENVTLASGGDAIATVAA